MTEAAAPRPVAPRPDWTTVSATGLKLSITVRPDSPVLTEFFAGYDKAFVLPDEKEDLDGFRACLALGQGSVRKALLARYGEHVEVVLVARDPATNDVIGGANFIAYPVAPDIVAGNLNYVFVGHGARGQGYFRRLVSACEELMTQLFDMPAARTLTFIELNDPFVLSDADYEADSQAAGVDQFDRVAIWSRLNARVLDFPYVQPPLSARQEADEGLIYAVLGAARDAELDPAILGAHLERFFGVSVLKGQDPWTSPEARLQLEALGAMAIRGEGVDLYDAAPFIEAGRQLRTTKALRPDSFRQFLRSHR